MSWAIPPLQFMGLMELIALITIVMLVSYGLKRGRRHEEERLRALPRRPGQPPPPVLKPPVNIVGFMFALIFSPFVLCLWAIASIGELIALPAHVFVGLLTGSFALIITLIGGTPTNLWRASRVQFLLAGRSLLGMTVRLLSMFGLGGLVERKSTHRPPPVPAGRGAAPGSVPGHRTYPFEDRYRIESKLGSGGSTARLFVVRRIKGTRSVGDRMVLKYFDMGMGSRLEEVIRESRGMQVAKDMGIVLDHHLDQNHFYYVMPYYEGETLTRASARLHRHLTADEALPADSVRTCLSWMSELLRTLDGYHRQGVIHKDVKPDNVIVTDQGVRLVDLGLLTPLASALTLTTHGTEYFRDPEMVKLAVQGKRVRDVEAVRFDIYSAGAVMYLLLDGSFPACGPLSRISRPVPMALSWITSRAMAEGNKRYPTMAAMRADLEAVVAGAADGNYHAVPVSALPSFSGFDASAAVAPPPPLEVARPEPKMAPPRLVPVDERPRPGRRVTGAGVAVALGILLAIMVVLGAGVLLFAVAGVRQAESGPEASVVPTDRLDRLESELANRSRGPEAEEPRFVAGPGNEARSAITPQRIVEHFLGWQRSLASSRLPKQSSGDLARVPVLLVGDETPGMEDLLAGTRSEMQKRGVLYHPSGTLADRVRKRLTAEIGAKEVREMMLAEMGGDTLPFVIWIRHLDFDRAYDSCRFEVVIFYGPFRTTETYAPPGSEHGR